MSEEIDHKLEDELGDSRMSIEGYRESRWVLLDYGSVVIHLFDEATREYYSLETLWADAKRIPYSKDEFRNAIIETANDCGIPCWIVSGHGLKKS